MSITRIFRVSINPELREEFEEKFSSISVGAVDKEPGFISEVILKPTKWAPNEYSMISIWENEDFVKQFAGEQWNSAVIPSGMERFIVECWVHHYKSWNLHQ